MDKAHVNKTKVGQGTERTDTGEGFPLDAIIVERRFEVV